MTYVESAAANLSATLPGILDEFRKMVASSIGGGIEPVSVRIGEFEFRKMATDMILATMPKHTDWFTEFLKREPEYLLIDIWKTEHHMPIDAIRAVVADEILKAVYPQIRTALLEQFEDVTFEGIVEAGRDAARAIRTKEAGVGVMRADQLDEALDMLERQDRPHVIGIVGGLMNAADVLERSVSVVEARRLRELGAYVETNRQLIDAAAPRIGAFGR